MTVKETKKVGEILIRIGVLLNENPHFVRKLEDFINSNASTEREIQVDFNKVNSVDLFQLVREKSENEVEKILDEFTIKELRELLKKYRFGSSSKLKTQSQIKNYLINQLNQRKTDVFHAVQS